MWVWGKALLFGNYLLTSTQVSRRHDDSTTTAARRSGRTVQHSPKFCLRTGELRREWPASVRRRRRGEPSRRGPPSHGKLVLSARARAAEEPAGLHERRPRGVPVEDQGGQGGAGLVRTRCAAASSCDSDSPQIAGCGGAGAGRRAARRGPTIRWNARGTSTTKSWSSPAAGGQ